jgi:hypothetical protein
VTRHRFLVLLLLLVTADFAVPYEPSARGVFELDDEQEAAYSHNHRARTPEDASSPPGVTSCVVRRPILGRYAEKLTVRRPALHPVRRARADLAPPSTSPEDH